MAPVIVVTGMQFEAAIAGGPGVSVILGQNRAKLSDRLHGLIANGARGIVSFGTAGGLDPSMAAGTVIVASAVAGVGRYHDTDKAWSAELLSAIPDAQSAVIAGVDAPVVSVQAKHALREATGAAAVDMESGLAAEVAARYVVPVVVLRIIVDPADRSIPISALVGIRDDGTSNPLAVIRSLLRRPKDLPAIIRLASDVSRAKAALLRSRQALGPLFSLPDAGKFPFHMK